MENATREQGAFMKNTITEALNTLLRHTWLVTSENIKEMHNLALIDNTNSCVALSACDRVVQLIVTVLIIAHRRNSTTILLVHAGTSQ